MTKHHIVSIGISKLQNFAGRGLMFGAKDATDFYQLLVANLPDLGYQKLLTDSEASLSQIRTALGAELDASVSDNDVFFFFFSGHGTTSRSEEPEALSHFLVPYDATQDISNSGISVLYIKEVFEKLRAKAKFIFIDSCFSGAVSKSKGLSVLPAEKMPKPIKTFTTAVSGTGSVIFTACSEQEPALEDEPNKNGLFTYFLLKEFQADRQGNSFSISDIFTPVTDAVAKRAKDVYCHTQTPTSASHLVGNVFLPVLKRAVKITPEILEVPRYPVLASASFPLPQITLTDPEQEQLLNAITSFIIENRANIDDKLQDVLFARHCASLLKTLRQRCEEIFQAIGQRIENVPQAVTEVEAASFQFVLLGATLTMFGNERQIAAYCKEAVRILTFWAGKTGDRVISSIPEAVIAEIVYVLAIIGIATEDFSAIKTILECKVWELSDDDKPPVSFGQLSYYHYCDALGGHADKINDHVRSLLKESEWLVKLVPGLEGRTMEHQIQANMLLSAFYYNKQVRFWPDFGRFYQERIWPLVRKIKYDAGFRKKISDFIGKDPDSLLNYFKDFVSDISQNMGGYHWSSIYGSQWLLENNKV